MHARFIRTESGNVVFPVTLCEYALVSGRIRAGSRSLTPKLTEDQAKWAWAVFQAELIEDVRPSAIIDMDYLLSKMRRVFPDDNKAVV